MNENWKAIAIIFIILFTLETITVALFINQGLKSLVIDEKCAYEICYDYDSYLVEGNTCYCFMSGEVAKKKYIW